MVWACGRKTRLGRVQVQVLGRGWRGKRGRTAARHAHAPKRIRGFCPPDVLLSPIPSPPFNTPLPPSAAAAPGSPLRQSPLHSPHTNLAARPTDEIDAIGTKRYDAHSGGEREIQRTMLELLNQLDGFDSMSDVKVRFEGEGIRAYERF